MNEVTAVTYTEKYLNDLKKIRSAVPAVERLSGSRFLITGAGGLICSALVDFLMSLELDIQIYAAGRSVEKLRARFAHWGDRLRFVQYDALEPVGFDQSFDYYIHGASNAHPAAYSAQPVDTMLANLLGVNSILRHAADHGARRVLYISSSEVYGKKEGSDPYHEQEYGFVDILTPRACYPSSKRAAETLCAAYAQQYGVDAVIVRPGHVYGPTATAADSRASTQFPRDVLAGKNIIMKSPGSQLRSYCYVLDCVSAMTAVLLHGRKGSAYNISNRHSVVTIRQMAQAFADAAGRELEFADPTDAEAKSYNLMDNSALDATALESLGWRGLFDLPAGVAATLDAMNGNQV